MMIHFFVTFFDFKIGILRVQYPVNNAESGFNTSINLNIKIFKQCLQWFRCKISDEKPQQSSSRGSWESYYIYI